MGYSALFLTKCKSCGFVFSEQIPNTIDLIKYYERYNRNQYLSPITVKRYEDLLDRFEKFRKSSRILDVGCGSGYFLEVAKQRGWEVFGTEFTEDAVSVCRSKGIMMHQGKLDTENYPASSFDIITSFEVLEHINDPLEEVKKFHALLRKEGIVYLTTPNFNSLSRLVLKEKWNVLEFPEHLGYYTTTVLKQLFKSGGFNSLSTATTGISITRARKSLRMTGEISTPEFSADEQLRRSFESGIIMKTVKQSANQLLTIFGIGDTIKATFIKK